MRWQFSPTAVSWLVFLLAVATGGPDASAQAGLDVFVTPIPNAPFSGVINVQRSIVQRDGSIAEFKTIRAIGRDSQGRIYNESRTLLPVSSTETPQVTRLLLYDPQTRASTTLFPQERIFLTSTAGPPTGNGTARSSLCLAHGQQPPSEPVHEGRRSWHP